jgi:hypothetical protein
MAGLTTDGFDSKTLADIEASIVARQRATIDANLDTTEFELIGQLNGIYAGELAELWEVAQELYDSFDPDKAVGQQQDSLYSLTATLRQGASKSTVVAQVMLEPGANIAAGDAVASVFGSNSTIRFQNRDPMVNVGEAAAPFPAVFVAQVTGPVVANAGLLTVKETSPIGWASITNALDAELGTLIESDSAYRVRRVVELAAQGGGTFPGMRADLLQLSTVRAAIVVENDSDDTVDGLPPHSFECVVRSDTGASDEANIAALIWGNKPLGINPFGVIITSVPDSEGVMHAVGFSRPTELQVYVALRLLTDPSMYPGDAATKAALVVTAEDTTAIGFLDVGVDVYAGRLIAAAMAQPGVLNAEARVALATITSFDTAPVAVIVGQREIATLDTSRISIGAFP